MNLDPAIRLKILTLLSDAYPALFDFRRLPEYGQREFQANLFYLNENGLLDGKVMETRQKSVVLSAIWSR